MSPIERKWWFMLPVMVLSGIATQFLLTSAELPHAPSFAGSLIFGLCIVTLYRGLSFCIWMGLLWVAPGLADGKLGRRPPASN